MPLPPVRYATLAIVVFLAIAGFDIVTGLEHWPFGSYPMYSLSYPEELSWLRLYAVTDRGEIALRGERDFAPFDEARLVMALERLQSARGGNQKLDAALLNLMQLYNRRKASPPLRALRLYTVRWALRPGLQGSEPPGEQILIAQVAGNEAERCPTSAKTGIATGSLRKLPNNLRWSVWSVTVCSLRSICRSTTVAGHKFRRCSGCPFQRFTSSPAFRATRQRLAFCKSYGKPRSSPRRSDLSRALAWRPRRLSVSFSWGCLTASERSTISTDFQYYSSVSWRCRAVPMRCRSTGPCLGVEKRGLKSRRDIGGPFAWRRRFSFLVFFAAGWAKLRNSGLAWMTATNMRSIWLGELFTHTPPTRLGSFLAPSTWLCQFAAVATVIVELSALPALFVRRLRALTLVGLFGLQVLIALMLGVYFTPHLVGYALFLPWERYYTKLRGYPTPASHRVSLS